MLLLTRKIQCLLKVVFSSIFDSHTTYSFILTHKLTPHTAHSHVSLTREHNLSVKIGKERMNSKDFVVLTFLIDCFYWKSDTTLFVVIYEDIWAIKFHLRFVYVTVPL